MKAKKKAKKIGALIIAILMCLVVGGLSMSVINRCRKEDSPADSTPPTESSTPGEEPEEEPKEDEPTTDEETPKEEEPAPQVKATLNEMLSLSSGAFTLNVSGENKLLVSASERTELGGQGTDSILIDGGEDGATVIAEGKDGTLTCADNGVLAMKNLTICHADEVSNGSYHQYLPFGGCLVFQNCNFLNPIYLEAGASAVFENCSFTSNQTKEYSVWVTDGTASFTDCTFTGYRGLKIHEFANAGNVVNVSVERCTFQGLSQKPGVVIGSFLTNPAGTTVSIKNSTFIKCRAWDNIGGIEGVHGFYETDIYSTEFQFITENNVIEYEPSTHAITYYAVEGGTVSEIPAYMWLTGESYPTTYQAGTGATVGALKAYYSIDSTTDKEFRGWYYDKACTNPFDGTVSADCSHDIVLYAKLTTGSWTKNY